VRSFWQEGWETRKPAQATRGRDHEKAPTIRALYVTEIISYLAIGPAEPVINADCAISTPTDESGEYSLPRSRPKPVLMWYDGRVGHDNSVLDVPTAIKSATKFDTVPIARHPRVSFSPIEQRAPPFWSRPRVLLVHRAPPARTKPVVHSNA